MEDIKDMIEEIQLTDNEGDNKGEYHKNEIKNKIIIDLNKKMFIL